MISIPAFALLVASSSMPDVPCAPVAFVPAQVPQQDPAAGALAEVLRLERLSAIAQSLQDPAADTVALTTEAVRLIGFAIWDENRAVVAEPTGAPRLHLAITDAEIRAYAQMFRSGHSVSRDDLIGGIDVLYHSLGIDGSVAKFVLVWLRDGASSNKASARALAVFLQDLGVQRAGTAGRVDSAANFELDPIQALLMLRVLSEDLGTPLRRAMARGEIGTALKDAGKEDDRCGPFVAATDLREEPAGWSEDAYAGGVTGLFGEIVGKLGEVGKSLKDGLGKANAIASIAKFIATYTFLKGDLSVEAPGQPLVRTLNLNAGEQRTLVARFSIDGTRVTDWMKENRALVALAGLDLDMPHTGPLKGIETLWDIQEGKLYSKFLIRLVAGYPGVDRVLTDANGEARIHVEGMPQPEVLSPDAVLPVEKSIRVLVTPQVKSTEIGQDLVDAVLGAIGISGGATGFLTPVIEFLYRMKWKGGRWFMLKVRDWLPAETIGQAEVTIRASGNRFSRDASLRMTLDRWLVFTDMHMKFTGGDAKRPNPEQLIHLSAAQREQIEAAMTAAQRKEFEAALKPEAQRERLEAIRKLLAIHRFEARGPGFGELHIHDVTAGFDVDRGCKTETTRYSEICDGDGVFHWPGVDRQLAHRFRGSVDLEKRVAELHLELSTECKVVSTSRTGKEPRETKDTIESGGIFDRIELQPPFDRGIAIPLKEVALPDMPVSNYYGVVSVPIKFGPQDQFKGSAIVSFSVTRKLKPKAGNGR